MCASAARRGSRAAIAAWSSQKTRAAPAARATGTPRSTTSTRPAGPAASIAIPSFQAPIVAVTSARKTAPSARPVSASRPDGMSTATLRAASSFMAAMAAAAGPRTGPWNPVPKQRVDDHGRRPSRRARQAVASVQPLPSSIGTPEALGSRERHRRVTAGPRRGGGQKQAHRDAGQQQMARGHEAVAAVRAGAADDGDPARRPRPARGARCRPPCDPRSPSATTWGRPGRAPRPRRLPASRPRSGSARSPSGDVPHPA